ncbi:MAG: hypothetical protein ABIB43_06885 [archaeon]
MKDSTLLKSALICSIIGISFLFLILQTTELDETRIDSLETMNEGDSVKVIGVVDEVTRRNNITFLTISQKVIITGIIFDDVELKKGANIVIYGELETYNGEKEILIEKINGVSLPLNR